MSGQEDICVKQRISLLNKVNCANLSKVLHLEVGRVGRVNRISVLRCYLMITLMTVQSFFLIRRTLERQGFMSAKTSNSIAALKKKVCFIMKFNVFFEEQLR